MHNQYLSSSFDKLGMMMPAFIFVIESPVVRHYGLAAIFISEESNLPQSLSVLSAPRERQPNIFDTIRPHHAKRKKPSLQSKAK